MGTDLGALAWDLFEGKQLWQSWAPGLLLLLSVVPEPKHPISPLLRKFVSWCMWRHNSVFIPGITIFVCAVLVCIYTQVVPHTGEQGGARSVLSCFGGRHPLGVFFQPCALERPIQHDP